MSELVVKHKPGIGYYIEIGGKEISVRLSSSVLARIREPRREVQEHLDVFGPAY